MLVLQQMDLHPLGVLVGNLCGIRAAPEGLWSSGSHQICKNELERKLDLVVDGLEMSQLVTLAHSAHVAL